MDTSLVTASILATICIFHFQVHCQELADFTCKHFTIDGNIQLGEDDNITIVAKSLQSIVCQNNTPEIFDIAYNFYPPNAVARSSEVYYIPPHKHEKKFFLNRPATLIIKGISSTDHNDANYTLKVNFDVVSECSSAQSTSFSTSHKKVCWTIAVLITILLQIGARI